MVLGESFLIYRLPKKQKFVFSTPVFNNKTKITIENFEESKTITFYKQEYLKAEELNNLKFDLKKLSKAIDPILKTQTKENFINQVDQIKYHIEKKEIKKAVLSRFIFERKQTHPFDLFKTLAKKYPNLLVSIWYHPVSGLWIQATPELLFKKKDKEIVARSLAGTFKGEKPTWTSKEIDEQKIVTDFLEEKLSKISNKPHLTEVQNLQMGNLWHLKSSVKAQIQKNTTTEEIKKLIHPTPAIIGYPKEKATAKIKQIENHDRQFYTGSISFEEENTSEVYVNIRCLRIYSNGVQYFSGAGITSDSIAENEWNETTNKINLLKDLA